MLGRIAKLFHASSAEAAACSRFALDPADFVWALGSLCALNRIPFDAEILLKQFPAPYTTDTLIHAGRALGFRIQFQQHEAATLKETAIPCVALVASPKKALGETAADTVTPEPTSDQNQAGLTLITEITPDRVVLFEAGTNKSIELSPQDFGQRYLGFVFLAAKERDQISDPDAMAQGNRFGFKWFVPELLKYKKVWRDVLLASLVIQLLALGTPLFTQTIIDKVVVHRTESTLIVIAIGMAVFMFFSAMLTWVRQYLVLHTGNRVDAVLASAVFDHLFKLPPRYFEKRPTGVIAARLHGVETIREFIASAAVTLILDLPFLLIFVGIMFWYSVTLTFIALGILAIVAITLLVPWWRRFFRPSSTISFCWAHVIRPLLPNTSPGSRQLKVCKWSPSSRTAIPIIWPTIFLPASKPVNFPIPITLPLQHSNSS